MSIQLKITLMTIERISVFVFLLYFTGTRSMKGSGQEEQQQQLGKPEAASLGDQRDQGDGEPSHTHLQNLTQLGPLPKSDFVTDQKRSSSDLMPLPKSDFEPDQGRGASNNLAPFLPIGGEYGQYLAGPSFQTVHREIGSSGNLEANTFPAQQYGGVQHEDLLHEKDHNQPQRQQQQQQHEQRHNQQAQHEQRLQLEHQKQLQLYLRASQQKQQHHNPQQQQHHNLQQQQTSTRIGQLDTPSPSHHLGPNQNAVTQGQMSGVNSNQFVSSHGRRFPFQMHQQRGLSRFAPYQRGPSSLTHHTTHDIPSNPNPMTHQMDDITRVPILPSDGQSSKRRSRANPGTITKISVDTENFRGMVEQFTGMPPSQDLPAIQFHFSQQPQHAVGLPGNFHPFLLESGQLRINEPASSQTMSIAPNDRGKAPLTHETNPASPWGKRPTIFAPTHGHTHSFQQQPQQQQQQHSSVGISAGKGVYNPNNLQQSLQMIALKWREKVQDKENWEKGAVDELADRTIRHQDIVEQIAALRRQHTAVNKMLDPNFPFAAMTKPMQNDVHCNPMHRQCTDCERTLCNAYKGLCVWTSGICGVDFTHPIPLSQS